MAKNWRKILAKLLLIAIPSVIAVRLILMATIEKNKEAEKILNQVLTEKYSSTELKECLENLSQEDAKKAVELLEIVKLKIDISSKAREKVSKIISKETAEENYKNIDRAIDFLENKVLTELKDAEKELIKFNDLLKDKLPKDFFKLILAIKLLKQDIKDDISDFKKIKTLYEMHGRIKGMDFPK